MRVGAYEVELGEGIASLDAAAWDSLTNDDDPFVEHAFLAGLETSGCVEGGTGWLARPVLVRQGRELVAALPLYERHDSFGEFIFDWGFANAAMRAGLPYYPKLTAAVPFTPAAGRRLLTAPRIALDDVLPALLAGVDLASRATSASSVHVLFSTEAEQRALAQHAFLPRLSYQFHWDRDPAWRTFDDYLAALHTRARKQTRKERQAARDLGLRLEVKTGRELDARDWDGLWNFYRMTIARHGSTAYLTQAFFHYAQKNLTQRVLATLAYRGDDPVAGALFFFKGTRLFGRYWGALEELPAMHFELCYYLPIEWGLANGITHFEAGAQGDHKIKRGLVPRPCFSSHRIHHPGLRAAIAEYLPREAAAVRGEMDDLWAHAPYKTAAVR
jgi:uncharacterized protein